MVRNLALCATVGNVRVARGVPLSFGVRRLPSLSELLMVTVLVTKRRQAVALQNYRIR